MSWRVIGDAAAFAGGIRALVVQPADHDAVHIGVIVWIDAGQRRRFERHLRRRLKEALDDAGIGVHNRQLDAWIRDQPVAEAGHATLAQGLPTEHPQLAAPSM